MVRLTKIYTRGGDQGETSLVGGERRRKDDRRFAAIGAVEEANAAIGLARQHCTGEADAMLARIQHDLFDLGADLATPADPEKDGVGRGSLRILQTQVDRLEREIDAMNEKLKPLDSFVLPGGTPAAANLHLARTIMRRAERRMVKLAADEAINPAAMRYANRVSDHLFVLGRHLNDDGRRDVLWVKGINR